MELQSTPVISAAKLPILNLNEFDLWKIRIEQYFLMTDYSLWEVIINGDSPKPSVVVEGSAAPIVILTAEQKLARENELKARGTLLMALSDRHQLKFNSHKDAKTLMEAIKKRFERNTETKKVQKTLLKQQFENFTGSSSEDLDQIHNRLQKLVSQLQIHGVSISQEDVNLKFLHSLPSEWKTHTLIWRNKTNLEEHSLDDLFNNLRIYEAEIDVDDLEEMDLRWQMAMLTLRARRFLQKTRKNLGDNRVTTMGFDMSKVECYNCHRKGHFARESEEEPANFALMAISSSSSSDNEDVSANLPLSCPSDRVQPSGRYNVVPPPITRNFMRPKPDLVFNTTPLIVESNHSTFNVQLSPAKPAQAMSHITKSMVPIIKDRVSDSEDESEPNDPQSAPSFVQPSEHVKPSRHSI
nr:hypothetical protein [Tanacetum cinerariifolium]